MRSTGKLWTAAVVALASGVFATTAAAAAALSFDNMYQTGNTDWDCWDGERDNGLYCRTDNATVTAFREPGMTSVGDRQIAQVGNGEYQAKTQLVFDFRSSGVYSGSGETDIIYDHHEYSGNVRGATWCNDATSDHECDQHYVEFDDKDPLVHTICHETGHAVGLTHGREAEEADGTGIGQGDSRLGCLDAYEDAGKRTLGSHNEATIDKQY